MNDFRPLGPPIRPEPLPEMESIVASTRPGLYKVDGKYQTFIPGNEGARLPIYRPAPIPAEPIESAPAIDFILAAMERLKDPQFPTVFWGTW